MLDLRQSIASLLPQHQREMPFFHAKSLAGDPRAEEALIREMEALTVLVKAIDGAFVEVSENIAHLPSVDVPSS